MRRARLEAYRNQLLELDERIRGQMQAVADAVSDTISPPGELSNTPTHNADRDTEGLDVQIAVEHTETQLLQQVDEALRRIADGSYGNCLRCGSQIAGERLDAIPYAMLCVNCAAETGG